MNKFQFHFGDYFNDGHGQYITIHVQTEQTATDIQQIINTINRDYPILEKLGMAREYDEPHISPEVWKVVRAFDYPAERFCEYMNDNRYDGISMEVIDQYIANGDVVFNVETIADIWIWMMNCRGANLEYIEADFKHFWFDDGYGCFLC